MSTVLHPSPPPLPSAFHPIHIHSHQHQDGEVPASSAQATETGDMQNPMPHLPILASPPLIRATSAEPSSVTSRPPTHLPVLASPTPIRHVSSESLGETSSFSLSPAKLAVISNTTKSRLPGQTRTTGNGGSNSGRVEQVGTHSHGATSLHLSSHPPTHAHETPPSDPPRLSRRPVREVKKTTKVKHETDENGEDGHGDGDDDEDYEDEDDISDEGGLNEVSDEMDEDGEEFNPNDHDDETYRRSSGRRTGKAGSQRMKGRVGKGNGGSRSSTLSRPPVSPALTSATEDTFSDQRSTPLSMAGGGGGGNSGGKRPPSSSIDPTLIKADSKGFFHCTICPKKFTRNSNLTRHFRIHDAFRRFTCTHPGCEKKFMERHHLDAHVRVHTGSRPFQCPLKRCERTFTDRSNCTRHIRTHGAQYLHLSPKVMAKNGTEFVDEKPLSPLQQKRREEIAEKRAASTSPNVNRRLQFSPGANSNQNQTQNRSESALLLQPDRRYSPRKRVERRHEDMVPEWHSDREGSSEREDQDREDIAGGDQLEQPKVENEIDEQMNAHGLSFAPGSNLPSSNMLAFTPQLHPHSSYDHHIGMDAPAGANTDIDRQCHPPGEVKVKSEPMDESVEVAIQVSRKRRRVAQPDEDEASLPPLSAASGEREGRSDSSHGSSNNSNGSRTHDRSTRRHRKARRTGAGSTHLLISSLADLVDAAGIGVTQTGTTTSVSSSSIAAASPGPNLPGLESPSRSMFSATGRRTPLTPTGASLSPRFSMHTLSPKKLSVTGLMGGATLQQPYNMQLPQSILSPAIGGSSMHFTHYPIPSHPPSYINIQHHTTNASDHQQQQHATAMHTYSHLQQGHSLFHPSHSFYPSHNPHQQQLFHLPSTYTNTPQQIGWMH